MDAHDDRPITRLAPSPTGALHLGNARTFLINHALAAQGGWRTLLRIDDLDGPRTKPGADAAAEEDLRWLGLSWAGESIHQSRRRAVHDAMLERLRAAGVVYECRCTRAEVERAAAGVAMDGATLHPPACVSSDATRPAALRARVGGGTVAFHDPLLGRQSCDAGDLGDFVVRKSSGEIGYQLASLADDLDLNVTHVVRGGDLLASTFRQVWLAGVLGESRRLPAFYHLPLVVGTDGRKLSKRHGDTRLSQLRDEGVSAGRVRAMLGRWSGIGDIDDEATVDQWVDSFRLEKLPREAAVYDDATDRPRA